MVAFIAIGTHNWQTTAQGQRGTGSWSASLCTLRVRAREGFTPLLARDRCCALPRALLCRAPMCKEVLGGYMHPPCTSPPSLRLGNLLVSSLPLITGFHQSHPLGDGNSFSSPWCFGGTNPAFSSSKRRRHRGATAGQGTLRWEGVRVSAQRAPGCGSPSSLWSP